MISSRVFWAHALVRHLTLTYSTSLSHGVGSDPCWPFLDVFPRPVLPRWTVAVLSHLMLSLPKMHVSVTHGKLLR